MSEEYKDSYDRDDHIFEIIDAKECGEWYSYNTETEESTYGGKMFSCLVDDGEKIRSEWITDRLVKKHT